MRKRFLQLCSGPLQGRTIGPDTAEHASAVPANVKLHTRFAVPATPPSSGTNVGSHTDQSNLVHIYEAFDLVDEISLEIVLCKYISTRERIDPTQN
jgi:hypothetical protein